MLKSKTGYGGRAAGRLLTRRRMFFEVRGGPLTKSRPLSYVGLDEHVFDSEKTRPSHPLQML